MIFKAPVPNSISTYSSKMIGIFLFTSGTIALLLFKCLYLLSLGFTHIAVSPKIVSGLVVAIIIFSSLFSIS